ncbi:MAG TPA: cytochrome c oxidase assembly protein [Anaeromyxobacteraceae bacterium]|nr:cytochrome c oxidase assembly protein [Anaeromyxobacteraceae bacterium]
MDCALHDPIATSWAIPLPSTLAFAGTVLLYAAGWRRLRAASPGDTPSWRLAAFVAGMIALWLAVCSPLSTLDHVSLTLHMVQHLVTMTVAAPLILLGRPGVALALALPGCRRPDARALLRAVAGRIGRALTHPVACWLAGTGVVVAWHVPGLHELGMTSPWHAVQHASFLVGGLLFWSPVIGAGRRFAVVSDSHAVLYLFLAALPCDALSAFLAFCGRVVYHAHSAHAVLGLSPLQDQELAGGLMWVWVTFAYLLPATFMTVRMLSPSGSSNLGGHVHAR